MHLLVLEDRASDLPMPQHRSAGSPRLRIAERLEHARIDPAPVVEDRLARRRARRCRDGFFVLGVDAPFEQDVQGCIDGRFSERALSSVFAANAGMWPS